MGVFRKIIFHFEIIKFSLTKFNNYFVYNMKPETNTEFSILPLLTDRWSPHSFSNQMVEKEKLQRLFEAARWSASSFNEQPWYFIYTSKNSDEYQAFLEPIIEFNYNWAKTAPILLYAIAQLQFKKNGKQNPHALYDLGAAVNNLALQATEEGLVLRQMAGFDSQLAKSKLNVPQEYQVCTAIALGYHGNTDELPENFKKQDQAPRVRKKIETFVFKGEWNNQM